MSFRIDPFTMRPVRGRSVFPPPPAAINVSLSRSETSSSQASYSADDASGGTASHEVYYSDGGDWTLADTFAAGVAITGGLTGLTAATEYSLYVKALKNGRYTDSEIATATTRTRFIDNLQVSYDFIAGSGNDLHTSARHLTLTNSPTSGTAIPSGAASAISFDDASSQYGSAAYNAAFRPHATQGFWVSLWAALDTTGDTSAILAGSGGSYSGAANVSWMVLFSPGTATLTFYLSDGTNVPSCASTGWQAGDLVFFNGWWVPGVGIKMQNWRKDGAAAWAKGSLIETAYTGSGVHANATWGLDVGAQTVGGPARRFDGEENHLRIWHRYPDNDAELTALYNSQAGVLYGAM